MMMKNENEINCQTPQISTANVGGRRVVADVRKITSHFRTMHDVDFFWMKIEDEVQRCHAGLALIQVDESADSSNEQQTFADFSIIS